MGLFDFFKRKDTRSTFPENELEVSLIKASKDVSQRNNFYMKLLWNDLYVLTSGRNTDEGRTVLKKDTTVEFVTFPNGEIPVFTSTNRIFDKGVIKEEVPFMAMKGQDLFGIVKGATLILNPYSDYGKELIPGEIESMLNGSIFDHSNKVEIKEDTEVRLGQPATYPEGLIEALCELFEKKKSVKVAYLGLIEFKSSNNPPNLIIAIDSKEEISSITNEAGPLAEKFLGPKEFIDFIIIEPENGVSDYFVNETEPFYRA